MALGKVSASQSPAENYVRINAAFAAIDQTIDAIASIRQSISTIQGDVSQRALQTQLDQTASNLQTQIDTAVSAIVTKTDKSAFDAQSQNLQGQINDLTNFVLKINSDLRENSIIQDEQIRSKADETEYSSTVASLNSALSRLAVAEFLLSLLNVTSTGQPGVAPSLFTNAVAGDASAVLPLDPAGVVSGALGRTYRIQGAGVIAPRAMNQVDRDAITVLRFGYWRLTDVDDPNNNAIDLGIAWLNASGQQVGNTLILREQNLRVQDGPRALTVRVPSVRGDPVLIAAPATAVAWRPYIRTYGADGATAAERLSTVDVTYAGFYAPDLYPVLNRLGTIEGQLSAGLPLTAPILPSYRVADLPKPGNCGRLAWASDGRARNPDGSFEAANAGTGVSVEDNGSKWVIPGTNQQVQA